MDDFRNASLSELLAWLEPRMHEFDDNDLGMTPSDKIAQLAHAFVSGQAIVEFDEHAFAVIRPRGWKEPHSDAVFWLIYTHEGHREQDHASALIRRVLALHAGTGPMVLRCRGDSRIRLAERHGFVVKDQHTDGATMIYTPDGNPPGAA